MSTVTAIPYGECGHGYTLEQADAGHCSTCQTNDRLGYDADVSDPSQYCMHGRFIGSWWGPDYMCGACEDGATSLATFIGYRMRNVVVIDGDEYGFDKTHEFVRPAPKLLATEFAKFRRTWAILPFEAATVSTTRTKEGRIAVVFRATGRDRNAVVEQTYTCEKIERWVREEDMRDGDGMLHGEIVNGYELRRREEA